MICEEVKISLHDYIDEMLDDFTKREVEQHIRSCNVCIKEYKKLMGFFDRLKELPIIIDPPKDIIEVVHAKLLNLSEPVKILDAKQLLKNTRKIQKERDRQEKELKKQSVVLRKIKTTQKIIKRRGYSHNPNSSLKKTLLFILPLLSIALGYFLYDLHKYNYPWKVVSVEGVQKINGSIIQNDLWSQGGLLSTDSHAKAMVVVPNVGSLEVGNNSRLILEKGKEGANVVGIGKGTVKIVNAVNMPELTFIIGQNKVLDRGGEFLTEVDNNGNAKINVKFAFVEIIYNDDHFYVDENYQCELNVGRRPGIPYYKDASDTLKAAIESFDRLNGGEAAVEKIISFCKEKDVLTLLALIPYVPQLQRQILFQEISNYFPPPESITRAGIIRLDKEMLYKWWEEIEWQL
jgi:hypothetical protein